MVRLTRVLALSAALALLRPAPASAVTLVGDPAIAAPIATLVNAFNAAWKGGPTALPAGIFSDDVVIIDLFAPFRWSGTAEASAWYTTIMPKRAQWQAAHESVTLGKPFITIANDRRLSRSGGGDEAYVVYPAQLRYTQRGIANTIDGQWAFTLRKRAGHWLITGHSWATIAEHPPGAIRYEFKP